MNLKTDHTSASICKLTCQGWYVQALPVLTARCHCRSRWWILASGFSRMHHTFAYGSRDQVIA